MLVGKMTAFFMTGSAAILSDAAESVIHVVAVAFAAFSLRLSTKPAAGEFLYGYERIAFFSAGFEGAMIVLAAILILYAAIEKMDDRPATGELGSGLGVVAALALVLLTRWKPFDPLVAINILWAGGHCMALGCRVARPLGPERWKRNPRQAGCDLRRGWFAISPGTLSHYGISADHRGPPAIPALNGRRRCLSAGDAAGRTIAAGTQRAGGSVLRIRSRWKTTRPCTRKNTTQESRSKCRCNGRGNGRHDFRVNLSLTLLLASSIVVPGSRPRAKSPDGHGTILTARFVALKFYCLRVRLIPRSSLALSNIGPVPPPGCSRA